jgi:hypothetical protein
VRRQQTAISGVIIVREKHLLSPIAALLVVVRNARDDDTSETSYHTDFSQSLELGQLSALLP